jgi:hypothetical protein
MDMVDIIIRVLESQGIGHLMNGGKNCLASEWLTRIS